MERGAKSRDRDDERLMRARDTLGYRDWTTASAILLFFVAVYLAIELRRVRIEERPKT